MSHSHRTSILLAGVAAAFWSANMPVLTGMVASGVPALVVQFHMVFWAAAALWALLFLSGRAPELRAFNRRETSFLVLGATGGFGLWVMRAQALAAADADATQLYFYAAPLMIGVLSLFVGRERAAARTLLGLVLGYIGCAMLVHARGEIVGGVAMPALAAAGFFAIFSLVGRHVVRDENVLPTAALMLSIGAACLLMMLISRSPGAIMDLSAGEMARAALAGIFTVALAMCLWLRALTMSSAASIAPVWYLSAVVALFWQGGMPADFWVAFGGFILVIAALRGVGGPQEHGAGMTFGDVLRGG